MSAPYKPPSPIPGAPPKPGPQPVIPAVKPKSVWERVPDDTFKGYPQSEDL